MKTILGSMRRHYLTKFSILLMTVALIAAMAGCVPTQYELTISSTEGGEVTTPGEGSFTYDEGTVVNLVAEVEEGYQFVNWTGNVSAIADVNAAATNITMNGDYSITANFAAEIPENLEIRDWYDLDAIRNNLGGNHTLMNDLNATTPGYEELASPTANGGKGWQPIGTDPNSFTGSFDGQGFEIRDLFIDRLGESEAGLFGRVDKEGVIQNLGVVNATVTGDEYVGGLVGRSYDGTVSNCYSTGNVTGDYNVGGLVGRSYDGTVSNSYSSNNVTGNRWVGGLVGVNYQGTVSNSYSTGSVTGNELVGGLVGTNYEGPVSNSYFTGSVSGTTGVGGVVGENCYGGTVSNSYYNYDQVLINGENIITRGALFGGDFEEWLANDKFLDFNGRLSQEDGYYVVNNVTDFKQLLAFGQNPTLKFRLKTDLDLGDEPNFYIPCLAGEFDGNGYKISNLSFDFDFVYTVGLFGYLAPGGKVTDLAAENVNITGDESVGGLVGYSEGTVSNSSSTGSVTGQGFVGGLVGYDWYLSAVSNSYFTGTVTGDCNVGGLAGGNLGTVSNSYSNGNVSGISWSVGGLVGGNGGTVSNSYSTASVTSDNNVGGLVGVNGGTVSNSYASGDVTSDHNVGGLMGANYGIVSNSYSTGSVSGTTVVGGLVGVNGYGGTVSKCYSTGSVTGTSSVGGLVGENGGTVSKSFWDIETSGQAASAGGTGKTTAEMQDIATFSGAGWDIIAVANPGARNHSYIWNIVDDVTYPFLSWEPV